ncbi:12975_t:CDS:1, partial [Racocetra fulgida]
KMSTSNNTTNVITQDCSGCGKSKPASEFTRQRGNKKIIGSTCNKCSDRLKQTRLNKKLEVE